MKLTGAASGPEARKASERRINSVNDLVDVIFAAHKWRGDVEVVVEIDKGPVCSPQQNPLFHTVGDYATQHHLTHGGLRRPVLHQLQALKQTFSPHIAYNGIFVAKALEPLGQD